MRPERLGASAEFLRLPLVFGRKNSSRGDYSERNKRTQGQLVKKRQEKCGFFGRGVENSAVLADFRRRGCGDKRRAMLRSRVSPRIVNKTRSEEHTSELQSQ